MKTREAIEYLEHVIRTIPMEDINYLTLMSCLLTEYREYIKEQEAALLVPAFKELNEREEIRK